MPSGACPECGKIVARSATSCPNCGNRNFETTTGNRLFVYCQQCNGTGCFSCGGKGYGEENQRIDVRDPSRLTAAKATAERANRDFLANFQKQRARIKQETAERERERELAHAERERKEHANVAERKRNRAVSLLLSGIVIAVLSYFVFGVAGCMVRIMLKNPSDPDYNMSFPFASWFTEALIAPFLIVVITAVSVNRIWKTK